MAAIHLTFAMIVESFHPCRYQILNKDKRYLRELNETSDAKQSSLIGYRLLLEAHPFCVRCVTNDKFNQHRKGRFVSRALRRLRERRMETNPVKLTAQHAVGVVNFTSHERSDPDASQRRGV